MAKLAKDRDRALAHANGNQVPLGDGDVDMEDDVPAEDAEDTVEEHLGSKVIVIHPGSRNLRIGLASDALPKTIPMVIARRSDTNECDENGGELKPKRARRDHDAPFDPEEMFGKDVGR